MSVIDLTHWSVLVLAVCYGFYFLVMAGFALYIYRRRPPHRSTHYDTILFFPLIQAGSALAAMIVYAVFYSGAFKDRNVALKEACVVVPFLCTHFGILLVGFFWKQLHAELQFVPYGRLFMPIYTRRLFFLVVGFALWVYIVMLAVLLTVGASEDTTGISNYFGFLPMVFMACVLGFLVVRRAINRDILQQKVQLEEAILKYLREIKRISTIAIVVLSLSVAGVVASEIVFIVHGHPQPTVESAIAVAIMFVTDIAPGMYVAYMLYAASPFAWDVEQVAAQVRAQKERELTESPVDVGIFERHLQKARAMSSSTTAMSTPMWQRDGFYSQTESLSIR